MRDWATAAFEPRAVAVVGASATPGKLGHLLMRNLLGDRDSTASFEGAVMPVHPTASEVLGCTAVPSLRESSEPIDLALVAIPPSVAEEIVLDAAAAGVPLVVLLGGGYAEAGAEGGRLQERLRAIAREGGVRLVGPNCFGLINAYRSLNASIALGLPRAGGVSLFTQSGAYGMAAFTRSSEAAMGFSRILSAGNKADIDEVDALRAFGADPHTRVIALVLESIGGPGRALPGRELMNAVREASARLPVVVLKTGRSRAGRRAAAGHTAALATDDRIARAALEQAGAYVVDDGNTLLDVAAALDAQGPSEGRRVGLVTNSGGTGVELADLLEAHGLEVPRLSGPLARRLAGVLPPEGSALNPVDVTTDWRRFAELYGTAIRELLDSDEVDAVVAVLLQRSALDPAVAERVVAEAATRRGKALHVCWVAPREADANRRLLRKAGVPCHDGPAQTARVLGALGRTCRDASSGAPTWRPSPPGGGVGGEGPRSEQPPRPRTTPPDGWLPTPEVLELLAAAGLPCAPWRLAWSADEAVDSARAIGFPVVLKAERRGLVHKSDAGAVALDVRNPDDVRSAWDDLVARLGPGPALVQSQVRRGLELMIGALRDPLFGPVVAVGLGGIWVELIDDVVWRVAPFGAVEAAAMLDDLRASPALDGLRGGAAVDRGTLARIIADVSTLVARLPWCEELDINPLIVNRNGIRLVDARLRAAMGTGGQP